MILKIFSVRDSKAEAFMNPIFLRSTKEAVRSFADAACDPNSMVCKHSSDYALYQLGEYDQLSGRIQAFEQPIHCINALEFTQGDAAPETLKAVK